MKRDPENPTYDHSLDTLCSESGYKFQREKYGPKLAFMKNYFGERFARVSLLDVGVGYGIFLKIAAEDYGIRNLSGMDPYPNSIELAKKMTTARIELGSLFDERWPFAEHSFDVITCFDVLEHIEKPDEFFVNAARYLRGGGIVLIPAFLYLLRLPIKKAFGTSLAVIAVIAIPGTIVHALLGHISWLLFLYLVIGVVPGAYIGAKLSIKAKEPFLYTGFGILVLVFGVIFIVNEIIGL